MLLLDALYIALSLGLSVFKAKYTAYGIEHIESGVYAHITHKKELCPCGHTWIKRERGLGSTLFVLALPLLENQLVFSFQNGETGHLASLTLEPSFLSIVSTLW